MQQLTEQSFTDKCLPLLGRSAHIKDSHALRRYNDVMAVGQKKNLVKEDIDQAGVVAAGVIDQAEKQLQEMSRAASDDEFDADEYELASLR